MGGRGERKNYTNLKFVGNISVIRQSRAAFPQLMTPEKTAETIRLWRVLYTKYIPMAQSPAENVLKTEKNNNNNNKKGKRKLY